MYVSQSWSFCKSKPVSGLNCAAGVNIYLGRLFLEIMVLSGAAGSKSLWEYTWYLLQTLADGANKTLQIG